MFNIKTLNSISAKGLSRLPSSLFNVDDEVENPAGILVRSANMLDGGLPDELLAIARAGAGTNNIPIQRCSEQGIVVFNTPGANANAVKELVLGGLVLASRNIAGGIEWVLSIKDEGDAIPKLVEKNKSKFVGPELAGKTLGVIGLGAIGVRVANMAVQLGMSVLGYDPFISIDAAWSLSRGVKRSVSLSDLISDADYITLHLPVNEETRGFISKENIAQMKPGMRLLNFARDELVNNADVLAALKSGRIASYVTDFPSAELVGQTGVVCVPHLGASTPESEENCAVMASEQLKEYLLNGNIINSVNLPDVNVPRICGSRICVIHKNEKGILAGLTSALGDAGTNIENMTNKSRGDYAYTILDIKETAPDNIVAQMETLDKVVRVRVI